MYMYTMYSFADIPTLLSWDSNYRPPLVMDGLRTATDCCSHHGNVHSIQLTISARLEITRPRVVRDLGKGGEGGGSMVMSYDVIDPNYDVMQKL